ncbi:hypothetical protein BHE74_00058586, partial [Ensete ventricosum]
QRDKGQPATVRPLVGIADYGQAPYRSGQPRLGPCRGGRLWLRPSAGAMTRRGNDPQGQSLAAWHPQGRTHASRRPPAMVVTCGHNSC